MKFQEHKGPPPIRVHRSRAHNVPEETRKKVTALIEQCNRVTAMMGKYPKFVVMSVVDYLNFKVLEDIPSFLVGDEFFNLPIVLMQSWGEPQVVCEAQVELSRILKDVKGELKAQLEEDINEAQSIRITDLHSHKENSEKF